MTVADLFPGHVLGGKYTIQSLLARSAAASTYRALASGNQEVAVKVLDAALADRQDTQNEILRVGSSVAALPASLVLAPLEHGKDPGTGALYIVTPFSPALSLARFVERPLPPEDVLSLLRSLGRALDEAHKAGIVHLALKPTNVFVTPGQSLSVVVGDFGANAIRTHLPDDLRQLDAAPWLAPEQMGGDGFAGPTADVFAAALLAFFALTGRRFWRSCAGAAPDLAAWRVEVTQNPMLASQRAAELGVMLPPVFDAAFAQAVSLPQHRQRTVGELAQAFAAGWSATVKGTGTLVMATAPYPFAPGGVPEAPAAAALAPRAPLAPVAPLVQAAPPQEAPAAYAAPAAPGEPMNLAAAAPGAPPAPAVAPGVDPAPAKGGSKTWLFVVLGVVVVGGLVGTIMAVRARQAGAAYAAAASASAQAAAASASAQAAAAAASAQAASALASASAPAVPAAPGDSAAPAGSAAPTAPAGSVAAADSAAPAASAAPADSAGAGSAPAAPATGTPEAPAADSAQLTIVCDPACDSLTVDQQPAANGAGPAPVGAGPHTIVASRAHYVDQSKTVTAKAGEKLTVSFKLVRADAPPVAAAPTATGAGTPAPGPAPTAKKPCGKFLKRCTD